MTTEAVADGSAGGGVPVGSAWLIAVLADGMGGHAGGSLASRMACETCLADLRAPGGNNPSERLGAGLVAANSAISRKAIESPHFSGMGCTLIGAIFGAEGLSYISVGDSLLYLWRRGALTRLNEDHSLAPEIDKLAEAGKISWAEAQADPRRHYLRAALTGDDIELIDHPATPLPLEPGDLVILASDGIHTLPEDDIGAIISRHVNEGADSQTMVRSLLRFVDQGGDPYQDNTTITLVRVLA